MLWKCHVDDENNYGKTSRIGWIDGTMHSFYYVVAWSTEPTGVFFMIWQWRTGLMELKENWYDGINNISDRFDCVAVLARHAYDMTEPGKNISLWWLYRCGLAAILTIIKFCEASFEPPGRWAVSLLEPANIWETFQSRDGNWN